MALFGRKTEKKKASGEIKLSATRDLSSVLMRPRITEKAANLSDQNVYVFVVRGDASKFDVRDAVKALFKVTPTKIRIVNQAARTTRSVSTNRRRTVPGMKKAYIHLKKGDRIDLV